MITAGALRSRVGGPEVMREQLERLAELAELPNIDLRVIAEGGAYPAMGVPFNLLSFVGAYPDLGYIELIDRAVYIEESEDLELYRVSFAELQETALSSSRSRSLIAKIVRSLR